MSVMGAALAACYQPPMLGLSSPVASGIAKPKQKVGSDRTSEVGTANTLQQTAVLELRKFYVADHG